MAIVKEIEIRVQDQQAQQGVTKLNELFKQVDQSVDQAESSTLSLRTQLRKLQDDMASGRLSGAEFNQAAARAGELRDAIGDANTRINALASDTQKLDAALSLGTGLAGAFSAAQGTMAVFGAENEEVQQAILKVQGSLAILNGVQAVANTLNKDSALMIQLQTRGLTMLGVAQKAYSVAVGTSTGLLKLFRIALISTGIGAIVVAVGLLIANFEAISKWVTDLIDKFGGWRKVLMFVAPPIWAIVKALEALGIIDDEETANTKKNAEERAKARDEEVKRLQKNKTALEDYYDFEIRLAKAAGKDVITLEKEKRAAIIQSLHAINEELRAVIQAGEATAEQIKIWNQTNAELKKLYQDDRIAQVEAATKTEEEKERLREKARQASIKRREEEKKLLEQQAAEDFRIFEQSLRARDKALEEQKKRREEFAKMDEDEEMKKLQDQLDIENELNRKKADFLRTDLERQLHAIDTERYIQEKKLEALEYSEEEKQRLLEVYDLQREEILEQELEREKILQEQKIALTAQTLGNVANLLGRSSKAGKAFAIAQALINTYQGVTAELATKTATPFEFGLKIANVATTVAMGMKAVKNIAKTNPSSSGSAGGASFSGGGGGASTAPSFNLVGDAGMNQIAQSQAGQQPVEAYVVAGNVTTAQSLNRNIINNATF